MRKLLVIGLLLAFPMNALSSTAGKYISGPVLVGEGKLRFMFWDIYEAKLFAPEGEYKSDGNFSLKLKYFRDFKGVDIAEMSIKEMKKQGYTNSNKLQEWEVLMKNIFPDVVNGSVLEGIFLEGKTIFYHDDNKIAEINDKEFGHKFFDIWLSSKTSEPRLRKRLLGII